MAHSRLDFFDASGEDTSGEIIVVVNNEFYPQLASHNFYISFSPSSKNLPDSGPAQAVEKNELLQKLRDTYIASQPPFSTTEKLGIDLGIIMVNGTQWHVLAFPLLWKNMPDYFLLKMMKEGSQADESTIFDMQALLNNELQVVGVNLEYDRFFNQKEGAQLEHAGPHANTTLIDMPQVREWLLNEAKTEYSVQEVIYHFQRAEPTTLRLKAHPLVASSEEDSYLLLTIEDLTEKQLLEEEVGQLLSTQQRFEIIFNNAYQFMGLLDRYGKLLEVNQPALDFAGVTLGEIREQAVWKTPWFQPGEVPQLRAAIHRAASGVLVRYETEVVGRDQQVMTIDLSLKPNFTDKGAVGWIIAEGRDISEKKRVEQELELAKAEAIRSQELLNSVVNHISLGVKYMKAIRDNDGNLLDFEFVQLNQQARKILFPAEKHEADIIGARYLQRLPDLGKANFKYYQQVLETGQTLETETQYESRWFHRVVVKLGDGVVTTLEDITSRKQAEIELQQSKQLIDSVYETASAGIDALTAQRNSQGRIIDFVYQRANQKSRAIKQEPDFDFIGKNLLTLYPGVKKDGLFEKYVRVVETGNTMHEIIYYGHEHFRTWFDLTVAKWNDGIIMTLVDITEQKLAEEKVKEDASLIESVFNNSEAVLQQYEAVRNQQNEVVDFIYVKTNKKGLEMAGMPLDTNLTGKRLLEVHPGVKATGVFGILERVTNTGIPEQRLFHYDQEGIDNWFQGSYRKLGDGVIVTIADITELKSAEQRLDVSERKFRTLVENTPDIISRLDVNFRFTFVNSAFSKEVGQSPAVLIGKTPQELMSNTLAIEQLMQALNKAVETKTNQDYYDTVNTPDGTRSFYSIIVPELNEEAQVQSLLVITRDITELKKIEERVRESEHFLLTTQEVAEIGSFAYNLAGNSLEGSPKLFDILDIPVQEQIDFSVFLKKFHPDDRQKVKEAISHTLRSGEDYHNEARVITESGVTKYLLAVGKAEVGEKGGTRMLGVVMDISHLRKAEQKLHERTQELELINQELSSFTYSISHDLRTPLRAIYGYTSILLEEYQESLDQEANRLLNVVLSNVSRMGNLVDDLLSFAHLGKKEVVAHPINIERLFKDIFKELSAEYNTQAELIVHAPLPVIRGDRTMMRQVAENLLSNALKFSSEVAKPVIEVGHQPNENHPVIYVRDNGVGFDQRYHEKLFEVFHRLHRQEDFKGTGVGLAIVQKIVQRHGGKIWAEGKEGEGATFFFSLS
uniref:histidine kinase n=1 Tax=Roseihalotalea indica TaxID=2867963 RepID=A0AA49GR75_9BACT|nr:PAS domain-containing protein [Tunicatimonas sp. TK19036]